MKNLSIVIQGPFFCDGILQQSLIDNLVITRSSYPLSEIIISTWAVKPDLIRQLESAVKEWDVRLVYSPDPGTISFDDGDAKLKSNINRMIVSSLAGISEARNSIVIKIRSDSCLINDDAIQLIEKHLQQDDNLKREEGYSIFDRRVINCNLFARDARGYLPYLFHPGDIMLIGYKQDLLRLFDIDLANSDLFKICASKFFFSVMNFAPEQYIWVNCIKEKTGRMVFSGNAERTSELVSDSERYYVSNYIPYTAEQLGFEWSKHKDVYASKGLHSIYRYSDWLKLYNLYLFGIKIPLSASDRVHVLITQMMKGYFYIRTSLLKIPYVRHMAIKLFSKRC